MIEGPGGGTGSGPDDKAPRLLAQVSVAEGW